MDIDNNTNNNIIEEVEGGVCAPEGFLAAGIYCGLRKNKDKRDLALIYSTAECNAAALYTSNKVKADPLYVTMDHLKDGKARAIIANSANANACAPGGRKNAERMAEAAAKVLGIDATDVVVASTGVIGVTLDIDSIEGGVPELCQALSKGGSGDAAEAIMTTDTYKKEYAVSFELTGKKISIGGISKGSGMIHPNMGTTLNFVTSDVNIEGELLEKAWRHCVNKSFNRISVDGDTSTNDMACIMVNGLAGNPVITEGSSEYIIFLSALMKVCVHLAKELAGDGEGCNRLITCIVSNASGEEKAATIAKAVIASPLTKAAMAGADANWGRVLCAAGYSGADFDYKKVDISFRSVKGEVSVCKNGNGLDFDEGVAEAILSTGETQILINLNEGRDNATAWGCDLTSEYVKINGNYRS
ncbi:bifunctional glutamate N-acetyltransferase/amino-acid acetyltransferase ArgJ [Bacillota bacterium]